MSGPVAAQDPDPAKVDNDGNGLIEIYTLSDLHNIRHNLGGTSSETSSDSMTNNDNGCPSSGCNGYELMNDLDFDPENDGHNDGDPYYNGGLGWQPIGTFGSQFIATFDGNGYKIANLFIDRGSENFVGLFGVIGDDGKIRNLGVVDATVSGNNGVGGLAGSDRGTITASYALATVSGNSSVGGLAGFNSGTITASYALATVSGDGDRVGGLVGEATGGFITASYALATVSGDGDGVGGLIGQNDGGTISASYVVATVSGNNSIGGLVGSNNSGAIIRASYALATISGNNQVGGLVGDNRGTITTSYAVATVSGNNDWVGGLVGSNNSGAIIRASYALATISGNNQVGGLAGWNGGTVRASYALATVSGNSFVGGLVGRGTGGAPGNAPDSYFDATFAGATSLSDSASSRTTSQLQTPDDYEDIYMSWNVDVGGVDTEPDDPWNFGSEMQYPALVLPLLATGACPVAISPAVMIGMAESQCIHRPVSRFASVELDDDRGARFDGIIFTNKRNPSVTARLLLPVGSTVRVVAGTTEVLMPTQTDANRRVTLTVALAEGRPNVFEALWVRGSSEVSLGELTITLDTTSPTLTVYREADGRIRATAEDDDNPAPIIRYARLDRASSDTCTQEHFSGGDLTDLRLYDSDPANADRFLDALEPDGTGNAGVYCFVAEDAAGNRAVFSSAEAVPAPVAAPAALRLRLRVFLESALP